MSLEVGLGDGSVICLLGFSFQLTNPINLFFSLKICLEKLDFYVMLQLGALLLWQTNASA